MAVKPFAARVKEAPRLALEALRDELVAEIAAAKKAGHKTSPLYAQLRLTIQAIAAARLSSPSEPSAPTAEPPEPEKDVASEVGRRRAERIAGAVPPASTRRRRQ
jgi:hypothetical protein